MNKKYIIVALFGESGTGKDTMQDMLVSSPAFNFHKIISCTTRPKRDYEIDGQDYYFLSEEDFDKKLKENLLLEYAEFRNWKYGTCIDNLNPQAINIGVFNIQGIKSLQKNPNIICLPILINSQQKDRLIRSLQREENPDCQEICRRFLADIEDFSDLSEIIIPYYMVANKDMNLCYHNILDTILIWATKFLPEVINK